MIERFQIYRCEICGTVVEMLHYGQGQPHCCGQTMKFYPENVFEKVRESHVPIVERIPEGLRVKVGSVPHPMEGDHYIEWIEIMAENRSCRHFFKPGDLPEAVFEIRAAPIVVREYCNLHGLWKGYMVMSEKYEY